MDKKKVAVITGIAVGATAAVVAAPIVIAAVGFGSAGVVAGSIAAGVQSSIGSVAAGSLFASLQSAGAVGFAASTTAGVGAAGGVVGGLTSGLIAMFGQKKNKVDQECQTDAVSSSFRFPPEFDEHEVEVEEEKSGLKVNRSTQVGHNDLL
ncbi:hypothetical protein CHUAL_009880 [Chamberlinius hualienensis]